MLRRIDALPPGMVWVEPIEPTEVELVPGGGLEPPWPEGLRILSRLRMSVSYRSKKGNFQLALEMCKELCKFLRFSAVFRTDASASSRSTTYTTRGLVAPVISISE